MPERREDAATTWQRVAADSAQVVEFCHRSPITGLAFFGSILRADFHEASDIDLLVRFDPDARVTYTDKADMRIELTELLGRPVDLRTEAELSPYFRDRVLSEAEDIYVRR